MSVAALWRSGQRPPSPGGAWQGALLSVLVHAGLLAVLLLGFRWQAEPPSASSAELWAAPPQFTPPVAQAPATPVARTVPAPVQPTPSKPLPDADIALEQARKTKAEEERRQKEQQDRELREKREKRERAEKAEKAEKAERAEKAEKVAQLEKARKEEAAQKAAKAEREALAKQEAQKELQRREQAAAEQALARQREEYLARMMGQLGGAGSGIGARGTAPAGGGSGHSASYAGRLIQAIKPNIVFGDTVAGNPAAEVEVRTGPGGTIIGSTLVKSSGIPEWDSAVLRAVERTGTLPKDTDGRVPPRLTISFRPKD
jgi:colicin import membrane protein